MKRQRPTIFDLERITGFSTGTISRAFNQSNRINAATRELILQKAREIGYAPHSGARSLIQGRTRRWGLLLPNLLNPRYAEMMDQLDLEARRRGTTLVLGLSRYDAEKEAELAFHWGSGETDGIISDACVDVFDQLRNRKFPIVFLFGRPSENFDMVGIGTEKSCAELMERCIKLGHRDIGFASPDYLHCRLHTSYLTYIKLMKEHGLHTDESLQFFGTHDYSVGQEAWAYWRNRPKRPTAVICFNDAVACGLIQSAQNDGCRVPEDLSVIGADDIPAASFFGLTTIRTDPAEIAKAAFSLLTRPHSRKGESVIVPSSVVDRNSIAAPAKRPGKRR
jgi:DNA-binding LacI/PurR family transcriptional regulator